MDVRGERARHSWVATEKEQRQGQGAGTEQQGGGETGGGSQVTGQTSMQCHLGIAVFHEVALLILHFVDEETEAQERCLV